VPGTARRASLVVSGVAIVLGLALLVAGVWAAIGLGPSGRAEFSSGRQQSPGIVLVGSRVLGHIDAPAEVRVTRADGGPVWLGVAHDADARAAVGSSPVLSVDRVHYPSGAADVATAGAGAGTATRLPGADVWQETGTGTGSAHLVVEPGSGPQTVVATSANAAALGPVRVTVAFEDGRWFLEAVALAVLGLVVAVAGLVLPSRVRRASRNPRVRQQPRHRNTSSVSSPRSRAAEAAPATGTAGAAGAAGTADADGTTGTTGAAVSTGATGTTRTTGATGTTGAADAPGRALDHAPSGTTTRSSTEPGQVG
jgi:hypothetical protein